jgi:hypothetical protein
MADTDIWSYEVQGTAADGQTWTIDGAVICDFTVLQGEVGIDVFEKLTQGKAVFGYPGLGCRGPYKVTKMTFIKGAQ